MKKKKLTIILLASIFVCSMSVFVACSKSTKLSYPNFLGIDENNVISWNEIELARGYKISIENEGGEVRDAVTENTYYSLDELSEGRYYIRFMAVGNGRDIKNSDWSPKYDFDKSYSTGLIYSLVENETAYEISNVGRAQGEIVIEDYYRDNKPVIRIGTRAFKNNKKITKITLGANVVSIKTEAFYACTALREIILPEGLRTIEKAAFQNCSRLKGVVIPSTLSAVPEYCFGYCREMEKVEFNVKEIVSNDGTKRYTGITTIGDSAFAECSGIKEITLPETLTGIERAVFRQMTALERITINASVEYINSEAFSADAALSQVTFKSGSKLNYIGRLAFYGCLSLETIDLPDSLEEIAQEAFQRCENLNNIRIPESVQEIGVRAFSGTKEYNEQAKVPAVIRGKFIYIDRWLVACNGVSDEMRNFNSYYPGYEPEGGLIGIAAGCFMNYPKLSSVELPASIRYLSSSVFYNCKALSTLLFEEGSELEVIGSSCFFNTKINFGKNSKSDPEVLYLPDGLKVIKSYAFYDCEELQEVVIPDSVTKIGKEAFKGTAIWNRAAETGRDGVVRIGDWAVGFNSDDASRSFEITFEEGQYSDETARPAVAHIADYAFANMPLLKVTGTKNLETIGLGAFYKCTMLSSKGDYVFELNNSFEEIMPYTFFGCKSFETITVEGSDLSTNLKTIGAYAFFNSGLKTAFSNEPNVIDFSTSKIENISAFSFSYTKAKKIKFATRRGVSPVKNIGYAAFYYADELNELSIPSSVENISVYAFFECNSIADLQIANGVRYINAYAFYGCDNIKTVSLPESLIYIGAGAFSHCYNLYSANFETATELDEIVGVKYIESYAFYGDEKINYVSLPASLEYIGRYAFSGGMTGISSVVLPASLNDVDQHIFYGANNLTAYAEAEAKPSGWSDKWNSSMRPVVWGATLSEDKSYVYALTVRENTFSLVSELRLLGAPNRIGYTFAGWALTEDGEAVYDESSVVNAPVGNTVYAVWREAGWSVVKNEQGDISYIVVGTDEVPEYARFDAKIYNEEEPGKVSKYGGKALAGWSFEKDGTVIFLAVYDDDCLEYIKPGTVLYAVYLDYASLSQEMQIYNMRHGIKSEISF